jgi:hypothetical protein
MSNEASPQIHRPRWNPDTRTLRFGEDTCKDFSKQAARNQEAILAAFEESGWPRRIEDPIQPLPKI